MNASHHTSSFLENSSYLVDTHDEVMDSSSLVEMMVTGSRFSLDSSLMVVCKPAPRRYETVPIFIIDGWVSMGDEGSMVLFMLLNGCYECCRA